MSTDKLAYRRAWYRRNREYVKEKNREYHDAHAAELAAAQRARYRADRERLLAEKRIYHQRLSPELLRRKAEARRRAEEKLRRTDPERCRLRKQAKNARSSANRNEARGYASWRKIKARVDYYGGRCYLCGAPWEHIDHVIPLSRGGTNWPSNLRPACARCNLSKSTKRLAS